MLLLLAMQINSELSPAYKTALNSCQKKMCFWKGNQICLCNGSLYSHINSTGDHFSVYIIVLVNGILLFYSDTFLCKLCTALTLFCHYLTKIVSFLTWNKKKGWVCFLRTEYALLSSSSFQPSGNQWLFKLERTNT